MFFCLPCLLQRARLTYRACVISVSLVLSTTSFADDEFYTTEELRIESSQAEEDFADEAYLFDTLEEACRQREALKAKEKDALKRKVESALPGSIYTKELELIGVGSNTEENRELFDAMVKQMLEKGEFALFAAAFAKKIRTCAPALISGEEMSYSTYRSSTHLSTAIELCLLITMAEPATLVEFIEGEPEGEQPVADSAAKREFLYWAITAESRPLHCFMRAFELNEGQPDNMAEAMNTWFALWKATPEKMRDRYLNLAIACSLISPEVANSPGMLRNPASPILTVPQVYDYFREMDARKKLLVDVKKMGVSQLLFVVDVRLPRSEFDWVHEHLKYSQSQWGQSYPSIRYLMSRATHDKDPYTYYTFEELRKVGGVCRDQAYFAANTAKCKGIPAVQIVGDGDRGLHAWIASMVDTHTWKQTASYGYNTGRFVNPCSGRSQHESVLLTYDKKMTDERLTGAAEGMIVSDYLSRIGCTQEARAAAKFVTSTYPRLTAAWSNRLKVLTAEPENMPDEDAWRQVSRELNRLGRHNPELLDFAAEVESKYRMAGKSVASQKSSMKRSLRNLQRNVGEGRSDLVLDAVERQAEWLVEAGDMAGLASLYKEQLKENTQRGDVFESLLWAYMNHWKELNATERQWRDLAKDVESIFNKGVLTNTRDHFKLEKEVDIQKLIARAYHMAGNERKAEKLRDSADKRLKNSQKKYQSDSDK